MGKWIKNWFSNFELMDSAIVHEGIVYDTVENFFQAMKTKDIVLRRKIAAASPSIAKKLGNSVPLREDWESIKLKVMELALRRKFAKGTSWHTKLMETGDEEIVEVNNWHDNYWGACVCDRCKNKTKHNHLGNLLMKIREEFKESGSSN